jgi:hypothetical protein
MQIQLLQLRTAKPKKSVQKGVDAAVCVAATLRTCQVSICSDEEERQLHHHFTPHW